MAAHWMNFSEGDDQMKVLVVSDSHGRHELLRKAIGQEAPIDMLIHAGDVEGDLDRILGPKREYEIYAVAGNMDWGTPEESDLVISFLTWEDIRYF